MQVITDLSSFQKPAFAVVTQGTFDGVHAGHREILGKIVRMARERGGQSVLVTFHPHPRHVLFQSDTQLRLLSTFDEKVKLLEQTGLDYLIVLPFNEELSKLSAMHFTRDILVNRIGVNIMVVGYDHRFGRNREGSLHDLMEYADLYGFEVMEIPAHDVQEAIVSSTKIRNSLLAGDIHYANNLLGRVYSLTGRVVEGRKMGKTIGYPTANIRVEDELKLIPGNGVYAVWVEVEGVRYGGMLNIGNNPTIPGATWSVEVHIFEFSQDIYGQTVTIYFLDRMRNEEKFASVGELTAQLHKDEEHARHIIGTYHAE